MRNRLLLLRRWRYTQFLFVLPIMLLLTLPNQVNGQIAYQEDFEAGQGAFVYNAGSPTVTTTRSCVGATLYDNVWSSNDTFDVSAPIGTATGDTLSITFDYKILDYNTTTPTTANFGVYEFQFGSSASGPWSTFYTVDQISHVPSATCTNVTVTGINFPAGAAFFRVVGDYISGDYDFYIDDIGIIEGSGPTCPDPTGLNTVNITASSATGVWESNGPGTSFQVEAGPAGFTLGTGPIMATVTDTFVNVSGLMDNTTYDWYVREICGMGDTSGWSGPASFTTDLAPLSNPTACALGIAIPDNQAPTITPIPINVSTAIGNQLGPNIIVSDVNIIMTHTYRGDVNIGLRSPNGAFVDLTSGNGSFGDNFGDTTGGCLAPFNFNMDSTPVTSFGSGSSAVGSYAPEGDFASWYDGSNPNGVWTLEVSDGAGGDVGAIQYVEIVFVAPPSCPDPINLSTINITPTSVTGVWTSLAPGTTFQVEAGPAGFALGTGPIMATVTDTFVNVTGLMQLTTYDWYVREICGSGDTSFWVGPETFTTPCPAPPPFTLPYFEDFEAAPAVTIQGNSNVVCGPDLNWDFFTTDPGGRLRLGTAAADAVGNGAATLDRNPSGAVTANDLVLTLNLSTYTLDDVEMYFDYRHHGEEPHDNDSVWIRGSSNDPWVGVWDLYQGRTTTFQTIGPIDIDAALAAAGQTVSSTFQVRFGQEDNFPTGSDGFTFDNIDIDLPPTCPDPTALALDSLVGTTAYLSYTPGGAELNWEIEYGPSGFAPGTGQILVSNDSFAVVTGLLGGFNYDFYVKGVCGVGDSSELVGPVSGATTCSTPLVGAYTIDQNAPLSATNFTGIAQFATAISACGVSGPVTVNVVANSGPYNERAVFGDIAGATVGNNITFFGNGNLLTNTATVSAERATLLLDGTDHMIIDGLNVEALGTIGFGIQLTNDADSNVVRFCNVNINQGSTSSSLAGIVMSNSLTSATSTGDQSSGNVFFSNTVVGGYYGQTVIGTSTTTYGLNNVVVDCNFYEFYFYGVYGQYQEDLVIANNEFSRETRLNVSSFYAVYVRDELPGAIIAGNDIHDAATGEPSSTSVAYPIYVFSADGTSAKPILIENNGIYNINSSGTQYGIYMSSAADYVVVRHNSVILDYQGHGGSSTIKGIYCSTASDSLDVRNNLVHINVNTSGNHNAVDYSSSSANVVSDHNILSVQSTTSANNYVAAYGSTDYADLASWQASNGNIFGQNSVDGDPLITDPMNGNLTPINGNVDNIGTPLGVTGDLYGNPRSATTPDAGAVEFTGLSSEMATIGTFLSSEFCYSNNDSVTIWVSNILGAPVDFSIDNLVVSYDVTGPNNTSGSATINSGTLALGDTLVLTFGGIDMSTPGDYMVASYISTNAVNPVANNDTAFSMLNISNIFNATPEYTFIDNEFDTVLISLASPEVRTQIFISEVCQFAGSGTGSPTAGRPTWLVADDYVEITGPANFDLGGITFEQWTTTANQSSATFPPGTFLGPNGTAIIATSQLNGSVNDPANFYYLGNGAFTGTNSSGGNIGKLLRAADGSIIYAVGYSPSGYTFPAASGVTSADWSSPLIGGGSSWGIRLEGPDDNTGANWVLSSGSPQDPGMLNAGIVAPQIGNSGGITWSLDGIPLGDTTFIVAGPFSADGIYEFAVQYDSSQCGSLFDTAIVEVVLPVNDSCFKAFEITSNGFYDCLPITSGGTANHANATNANWFYFDAPSDGEIFVSACGTLVDTRLWVMTGVCDSTVDIAGDDDGCGPNFESFVSNVAVDSGVRYYIQWDDRWSASPFQFEFRFNSCLVPQNVFVDNVTGTSVDVNFTATGTAEIEWGPFGFAQGSGTVISPATSPQPITGLMPETLYTFYIRQICSNGDTSDWGGPIGFTTALGPCDVTAAPTGLTNADVCDGESATLTVTLNDPNNTAAWALSSGGPIIGIGNPYTTDPITANTTYFVAELSGTGGVPAHVGPVAPGGALTFPGANFSNGMWFTVDRGISIDSMTLVVNDTLDGTINILSDQGGALIASFDYSLPSAGTFQIPVDVILPAGNYYMRLGNFFGPGILFRSTSGANFPYEIPNTVSLDSTSFGGGSAGVRYYYFWDWVVTSGCIGPDASVSVNVTPDPSVSFTSNYLGNFEVEFTETVSTVDSIAWDFGDGNGSTASNPTHTYATDGTYTICLTAWVNGCDSTICETINVATGLNDELSSAVAVHPNPNNGNFTITTDEVTFSRIVIRDLLGNVVYNRNMEISKEASIELGTDIAAGSYLIYLYEEDNIVLKRITITK